MNITVTSVSKTEQKLSQSASAIFVITQEDIRRSGDTNIPDLLRMVPGLDIAQINANTWAISSRGLNGRLSNELLVLVDGRTVYTPLFGGVFWDVLDLPLEDIERIEVIRGPGGSIWGSNAVNGVINIVTKKAAETPGAMIVAGAGNVDQGFGTVQYGGKAGKNTQYRIYTKYFNQTRLPGISAEDSYDAWHLLRGGFRLDSTASDSDKLSVQGGIISGRESQGIPFVASVTSPESIFVDKRVNLSGGFLQFSWNHTFSSRSNSTLTASYNDNKRTDALRPSERILYLDFQHNLSLGTRQNLVWGAGYRYAGAQTDGGLSFSFSPPDPHFSLVSAFIQDEIALVPNRFIFTAGTKLEAHSVLGSLNFDFMPSASLAILLDDRNTVWSSVSRALRVPADTDTSTRAIFGGFTNSSGTPVLVGIEGNSSINDEGTTTYEIGYRASLLKRLSFDLSAYFNEYDRQETTEPAAAIFEDTPAPPHIFLPFTYQNLMHGEAHGLEASLKWDVMSRWTLSSGYSFEQIHMHLDPTSQDTTSVSEAEESSPVHAAQTRSHWALPRGLGLDASAYFTDRIGDPAIPAYTRLDIGITRQWGESVALSAFGQNLLKDRTLEYLDTFGSTASTLVKRGFVVKLVWHY